MTPRIDLQEDRENNRDPVSVMNGGVPNNYPTVLVLCLDQQKVVVVVVQDLQSRECLQYFMWMQLVYYIIISP